ncbi:MAG: hypothetical protein JWO36_4626 [Myxococcales bacterium]|nr:hypothetical protein [Myxococcales bacterium]
MLSRLARSFTGMFAHDARELRPHFKTDAGWATEIAAVNSVGDDPERRLEVSSRSDEQDSCAARRI